MTALENVMVGRHVRTQPRADRRGVPHDAVRAPGRDGDPRARAGAAGLRGHRQFADYTARNLSYGDQRRLEIARALATDPKLLALDEPAAGMNATEKVALRELLDKIRSDGRTILLIEHDVKLVMGLCDRDDGARLRQADRRGHCRRRCRRNQKVIEAYLGAGHEGT